MGVKQLAGPATGGLTLKRHKFAVEYLRSGRNGVQSYRKVFNPKTDDDQSVSHRARNIINHPIVQGYIRQADELAQERIRESMAEYAISKERVVLELARMGFSNMGDYLKITSDGDPYIDLSNCTPNQLAAISETQIEDFVEGRGEDARTVRKVKIKLHDKKGSLVELAKIMGWMTPVSPDDPARLPDAGLPPITINFVKSQVVNIDKRAITVEAPK